MKPKLLYGSKKLQKTEMNLKNSWNECRFGCFFLKMSKNRGQI